MTEHYEYDELGVGEIRVLDIFPQSNGNDGIHIKIRRVRMNGDEPYFTLSYTWGKTFADGSHLTHTVYNSGTPIEVTENLYQALNRVRGILDVRYDAHGLKTETRAGDLSQFARIATRPPLWVDAICINQGDHREQSSQVRIMGKIYTHSRHLIIWLGREYADSSEYSLQNMVDSLKDGHLIKPSAFSVARLGHMLDSPWFSRRWVIQEYNLKKRHSSILLDGMLILDVTFHAALRGRALARRTQLLRPFETRTHDLLDNLRIYNAAECSDSRDRIYALRSISVDGDSLDVDYSKGEAATWFSFAQHCINNGQIIKLFFHATGHCPHASFEPVGKATVVARDPSPCSDHPHSNNLLVLLNPCPHSRDHEYNASEIFLLLPRRHELKQWFTSQPQDNTPHHPLVDFLLHEGPETTSIWAFVGISPLAIELCPDTVESSHDFSTRFFHMSSYRLMRCEQVVPFEGDYESWVGETIFGLSMREVFSRFFERRHILLRSESLVRKYLHSVIPVG